MKDSHVTDTACVVTRSGMTIPGFTILLALMSSVVWMGSSLYIPAFPEIGAKLGMSGKQLSATLTLFNLSFAFLMPVVGPLSDAWGRRPFMLAGMAVFSVGSLICGLAPGSFVLYAGRILQGLGFGLVQVPLMAMVRDDCEGPAVYSVLGLLGALTAIVPVLAMVLGGVVSELYGWRPLFFLAFLFSLISVCVCRFAVPETLRPGQRIVRPDLKVAMRIYRRIIFSRQIYMVGTPLFICVACEGAYLVATPFVFSKTFELPPTVFALYNILIVTGIAAGQYLSATLVKRFSPSGLYMAGGILSVTGGAVFSAMVWTSAIDTAFRFILPMLIFSFSFGFMEPIGIKSLLTVFKDTSAMASAIYFSLLFAMQGAGSIITGALMGWPLSPLTSLAVVMAGSTLFVFTMSCASRRDLV